ncbi:MAG: MGMT family protein, partial [Treponema sp.]|nr:MGMT family protein [Treponema sp.]
ASSLSHNPLPLLIPCHRIVASNGNLAGYQGGIEMKRSLLENESIPIRSNKVIMEKAKFWDYSSNS